MFYNFKEKTILVTGGTGFIGRSLVEGLIKKGAYIKILDNDSRGSKKYLESVNKDIKIITGDIRDRSTVNKAIKGCDMVCHLAYINGTQFFYDKPDLILDVALSGMLNLLYACIDNNVGQFILASSSEVYQTADVIPTPEDVKLVIPDLQNPRFSYGGGKIACELLLTNFSEKYFDRTIIFRPHNVYGPNMGFEHVIPQFILRMKKIINENKQIKLINFPIQGSGNETRSFIYIDDFVKALSLVIEKGLTKNVYHIGTMNEISIKKLASIIASRFNVSLKIIPGKLQKGGTHRRCPDTKKILDLGFAHEYSINEGIVKTIEWYIK